MTTVKETTDMGVNNQLKQNVKDLIRVMNSENKFKISIVEDETTSPSWFKFLLEYPPYEDCAQKFQRRISSMEAKTIAWDIFYNIKDFLGYNYNSDSYYVAKELQSFSAKPYFEKQFQFTIGFIENK